MHSVRELLLKVDIELEDYSHAIARARDPALTNEARLKLIEASAAAWRRLDAAHRRLDEVSLRNPRAA